MPRRDGEIVVEPRRRQKLDRGAAHDQRDAGLAPQPLVLDAAAAQHLGARALGEFEIVGVIDDAARRRCPRNRRAPGSDGRRSMMRPSRGSGSVARSRSRRILVVGSGEQVELRAGGTQRRRARDSSRPGRSGAGRAACAARSPAGSDRARSRPRSRRAARRAPPQRSRRRPGRRRNSSRCAER